MFYIMLPDSVSCSTRKPFTGKMSRRQHRKSSSTGIGVRMEKNHWETYKHVAGRNRHKKKKKVMKVSDLQGVLWSALVRLRRLAGTKNLKSLIDNEASNLLMGTRKLIRVNCTNIILEDANSYDAMRVTNLIHHDMPKSQEHKAFLPKPVGKGGNSQSENNGGAARYVGTIIVLCLIYVNNPLVVSKVMKVNNPHMEAMYTLMKEEYCSRYGASNVKELTLFHSTRQAAVSSIVSDNFDWRLVTRSRFGQGICFSSNADYANCHANRRNGLSRAFVLCKVLVCRKSLGSPGMKIPPEGYDTAIGGRTEELVYVKFKDNEFLPTFVAYYNSEGDIQGSRFFRMPNSFFS